MIFDDFKKKIKEKHLTKLLSQKEPDFTAGKITSLGVILNIDEEPNINLFKTLAEDLEVHSTKFRILVFSKNDKEQINSWDTCFSPKDFNWKGVVKNPEMHTFLDFNFDLLISYYENEVQELKLITAYTKAKFKVGILQTDERVNDLIIKTKIKAFKVFKDELIKYLKILNKI